MNRSGQRVVCHRGLAIAALALAVAPAARDARALEIALPTPGSQAWRPVTFRSVDEQTHYSVESHEGAEFVRAASNCSASGLVFPLDAIHLDQTPLLSWRWRIDRSLDLHREQTKDEDDFAARVYVLFELDASRASALQRLRHRLGTLLYGKDAPGSALNFVWTSRLPEGTVWDNPFESSAKMIAIAQGDSAGWRSETVDVVSRYRELFAAPTPRPLGLAIMTDSDNSCQRAEARFADFAFRDRPRAEARDAE